MTDFCSVGQVVNLRTDCQSVQPGAARPCFSVGRTPSSARDPLVALLSSSPTLTIGGPLS
jgi:hypothetical protein